MADNRGRQERSTAGSGGSALFLPLAAWLLASRRKQWDELLAATVVTVSIAIPTLVLAAIVEVYVSPHFVVALLG